MRREIPTGLFFAIIATLLALVVGLAVWYFMRPPSIPPPPPGGAGEMKEEIPPELQQR